MTTQTSIESYNVQQAQTTNLPACFGTVTYDIGTFEKAGTLAVGYKSYQITFDSVADYISFVNNIIIPLTNKILYGGDGSAPYVGMESGVAGPEPIKDAS